MIYVLKRLQLKLLMRMVAHQAKEILTMMELVMLMTTVTTQHQVLLLIQLDVQTARLTVMEMVHSMM